MNIKLLSFLALSFLVIFSSCKKDDDPSPEEQKIEELSGTWDIVSANVLDEDLTGISINFNASNTTYSVSGLAAFTDANLNHTEVLGASGSFSLNENLDVVTLANGGDLTIGNINKETGDLTLSYSAPYPKATDNATNITLSLKLR
ncbi:hypothetical protein SAMN05661096_02797 [Marivirga sericea]|uniref:Lipocalin-like domain-containing protein n=1 Tax=Marivirga sericea TaxID=1028 RepID=A0A1X7KIE0_9BACT|nr:hypothetical protein [Marivirga sericea]SMG40727.1 hypothetical protein SAMN05661096_02797 [Marivirga sericea]